MVKEDKAEQEETAPLFSLTSRRFHLVLLIAFGFCGTTHMRADIAMAMTCMVNSTAISMMRGEHSTSQSVLLNVDNETEHVDNSKCQIQRSTGKHVVVDYGGQFLWDPTMQNLIFSGTFWGSLIIMLPSMLVINRWPPRMIFCGAVLIYSVCTVIFPYLSHFGFQYAFASRLTMGFGESVIIPSVNALIANWFPVAERSTAIALFMSGLVVAIGGGNLVSAKLCESNWRWPSIFYTAAAYGFIWSIIWYFLSSNRPSQCRLMSRKEREYLSRTVHERNSSNKKLKVPYRAILTSKPFWAQVLAQFSVNFFGTFLQVYLPSYFKEVLFLNVLANGAFVAIPNIVNASSNLGYSIVMDKLKQKKIIGMTTACKLSQCMGNFGTASCMLAIAWFGNCDTPYWVLVFLCTNFLFMGMFTSGSFTSLLSLAPQFAGTLSTITMFIAMLGRLLAPFVVGLLKDKGTIAEWQHVLYVISVLSILTGIVFAIWGSAELQPWADDRYSNGNIEELHGLQSSKEQQENNTNNLMNQQFLTSSVISLSGIN